MCLFGEGGNLERRYQSCIVLIFIQDIVFELCQSLLWEPWRNIFHSPSKSKNARGYSVSLKVLCESCSTGTAVCLGWGRDCVEMQQGWHVWVIHTKQSLQSKYCLVFQVVIAWTNWGRFSWWEQQQQQISSRQS